MDPSNFAVINACNPVHIERESDVHVDYTDGIYFDGPKMVKKCLSWHSIPAAFGTEFFVYKHENWQKIMQYDHILVMIKDDLATLEPLIKKFKLMGKIVGIAFHENGNYFSNSSQNLNWLLDFKKIADQGDYFWNVNMHLDEFFNQILSVPVFSSWHGIPYEWNHGLIVPREDREGIMIGTRTLSQYLRRNTLYAIGMAHSIAEEFKTHITYFSEDPIPLDAISEVFASLGLHRVNVVKGPRSYEEWLKVIASHRVLFHTDASETLGQVVGDAMLLDVPSVGSFSTNNELQYTQSDLKRATARLGSLYEELVAAKDKMYDIQHVKSRRNFKEKTSFEGLRKHHEENLFSWLKK